MSDYWQRLRDARVSRRRLLAAGAALGATAASLPVVGCGSSRRGARPAASATGGRGAADQPDVLNPGGTPVRGGRYRYSVGADFGSWDPHTGVAVASAYFPRLYNVLLNQSAARPGFFYFDLASSLETPNAQTYIFQLRPNVRITPNDLGVFERALDGEDVRLTLERIAATKEANNYTFAHDYIAKTAVASDAVTVTATRPYAWFISRIGLFFNTIVPRELLAGDPSRLATRAAGGGPYRLAQLRTGQSATFDRNPNYYRSDPATGAQLPYVDGLDVSIITDRSAAHTAFLSGQIDGYLPADGREARTLGTGVTIGRDPNFSYISFTMNAQRPPFTDARVRRAFSRAINRDDYVRVVYGGDARPDGLVHWSLGDYALDPQALAATYQPFDIGEAKKLVSQVGGIRVKIMYPGSTDLEGHSAHLPIFLGQMKAAGIEIESDPQPFGSWLENYRKLNYDCSLSLNQLYETPESPLGFHTNSGPLGDGSYVRGLGDPQIEAAVKKANETIELPARIAAVHEAQKVIYAKDPITFPLVTPYDYAAYGTRVHAYPAGIGTTAFLINTFWLSA
ncbi:MAG: ABC transporter substrate-binding protein [Dehalococcoidia bacterium]|nr:ABC transporter substrate-binding protein [Dehalococcoidia bacterium]